MKRRISNNNLDLLYELVKTSFTLKYNASILGFLWVLLKPFMQFLILYIVFANLSGNKNMENYTLYLLSGLIIFEYFREGIMTGIHALLDKAHIILKVNFNKVLAIYSTLLLALINFIINFLIIVIFSLFVSIHVNLISFLYFIFIISILSIFITGVSFFTSIIVVKIRDLQHIAEVGLQLLFYATPIFYQIEIVPEPLRTILKYNPLFIILNASRSALIDGTIVYQNKIVLIGLVASIILITGFYFFKSEVTKIAEKF